MAPTLQVKVIAEVEPGEYDIVVGSVYGKAEVANWVPTVPILVDPAKTDDITILLDCDVDNIRLKDINIFEVETIGVNDWVHI